MKPDCLLFDMGGVLVEFPLGSYAGLLGNTCQNPMQTWIGCDVIHAHETGRIDAHAFAARMIRKYGLDMTPEAYLEAFLAGPAGPFPGMDALLTDLSKRYRLACLSNISRVQWDNLVQRYALDGYFEQCFLSCDLGVMKPDTKAFAAVCRGLSLPPERIVFFDDVEPNVQSAQAFGMRAHLVRDAAALARQIAAWGY